MTTQAEIIRQIADLQLDYKEAEQDLAQLKDVRNSLAEQLDYSDGPVKGCGLTISKVARITITPEVGTVDPEMYAEYVRLETQFKAIEKALRVKAEHAGGVGLRVSESIRITGEPEVRRE